MNLKVEFHGLTYKQFITHFNCTFSKQLFQNAIRILLISCKCIITLKVTVIFKLKKNSFAAFFATFM